MNDLESYDIARAVDSDDDRPVGELMESDVEMLRRIFPGRRDPMVHEFNDLTHSDQAFTEGRDDELQEALEAGPSMEIEKGRVFNDLPALKRWLQVFAVIRKRPYKVLHSYVERRYTVVCDKERCPWRVCARKQNSYSTSLLSGSTIGTPMHCSCRVKVRFGLQHHRHI
jgi:hypothetical protein